MKAIQWRETLQHYGAPIQRWYKSLAPREQWAVLALGVVFLVFCLYTLVFSPVMKARDTAKQSYEARQQVYEWIQAHSELIKQQGGNSGAGASQYRDTNKDVLTVVNATAREAEVTLRSFTPEGNHKLRLQLEQQEFTRVMQWLYQLEQHYGIAVETIDISAANSPGTVNVRATLERG